MAKFTFAGSEKDFDLHIKTSIRGYNDLSRDVLSFSRYFVENHTNVVDLGCSTGKLLKAMITQNQSHIPKARYIGVERESDFFTAYEQDMKDHKQLTYFQGDIRDYHFENCSFITAIFTLQFMPRKDRALLLERIYHGLNHGGAFIYSEKVLSSHPRIQNMMTFMYYDYKREQFSDTQILDKEVQLRHMMKSNTSMELRQMCSQVGFKVYSFWQNFNFVAFIALKE